MSDVDRAGGNAPAGAPVTINTNRHRPYNRRHPVSGNRLGVGCSAAGRPWVGPSVTAFYRDHLWPMIPKGKPAGP